MSDMKRIIKLYEDVGDDYGRVEYIRHSGSDQGIIDAARVSFGREIARSEAPRWRPERDPKLLRYLIAHQHWSPLEHTSITWHIVVPLFVRGQWHRHRTWCLAGDNRLHFDLPGGIERRGSQLYTRTIREVYKAFHRSEWSRRRVQNMHLRCALNDEDPGHTRIVDIWSNGIKPVIEVQTEHRSFKATKEHQVLATGGVGKATTRWVSLGEALELGMDLAVIRPNRDAGEVASDWDGEPGEDEHWEWVPGWKDLYQVSTYGRVRSFRNTRGNACAPFIKKTPLNAQGYPVVSLSRNGVTETRTVHSLVLEAFRTPKTAVMSWTPEGQVGRHLNGVRWDNRVQNLQWGTAKDNIEDAREHGSLGYLQVQFEKVVHHRPVGEEEVFDLEVEGPDHNFSCEGFVVHNSYNEVSRRYTSEDLRFFSPTHFRPQAVQNKQASIWDPEESINPDIMNPASGLPQSARYVLGDWCRRSLELYNALLDKGVSREQARMVLPQNMYTRFYGTANLRNALAFIKLRYDTHSQQEIFVAARAMTYHLTKLFPHAMDAWYSVLDEQGAGIPRVEVGEDGRLLDVDSSEGR